MPPVNARLGALGAQAWWRTALAARFELSRGGVGHNVRSMEGLRGLAVFLVFLVHFVTLSAPWVPLGSVTSLVSGAIHAMGNVGVDLFFVLSGYLIYGSLIGRPQDYGAFMRRRARRIYPAYLVVLAIYLLLSLWMSSESKLPTSWLSAALLIVANVLLLPGLLPITAIVTVAWSLSYEFFYYLTMPVVIAMAGLRERSARFRVGFWVVLALALAALFAVHGGPVRLLMFLPGVLLHEYLTMSARRSCGPLAGLVSLVAALGLAVLPFSGPASQVLKLLLIGACFFVTCLSCFAPHSHALSRAFSFTPLRWLGNMSYSYYLIHGLALKALFLAMSKLLPPALAGPSLFWLLLLPGFALTCLPSVALFLVVERPFSLVARPIRQTAG